MAKSIKDHLENTFADLDKDELKKFKTKLRDRKQEPCVRRATIDKLEDHLDLADLMVNTFTSTGAVPVTLELLEVIGCNERAEELRNNTGYVAPVVPQPGPGAPSTAAPVVPGPGPGARSEHFIDRNRKALINRVNNVKAILDELLEKNFISDEDCSKICAEKTKQDMMRELLTGPIKSAGTRGKDALYEALKEIEVYLMQDLESQGK